VSGVHERRAFMCTTSGAPAKRSRSRKCRTTDREGYARRSRLEAMGAAMRLR